MLSTFFDVFWALATNEDLIMVVYMPITCIYLHILTSRWRQAEMLATINASTTHAPPITAYNGPVVGMCPPTPAFTATPPITLYSGPAVGMCSPTQPSVSTSASSNLPSPFLSRPNGYQLLAIVLVYSLVLLIISYASRRQGHSQPRTCHRPSTPRLIISRRQILPHYNSEIGCTTRVCFKPPQKLDSPLRTLHPTEAYRKFFAPSRRKELFYSAAPRVTIRDSSFKTISETKSTGPARRVHFSSAKPSPLQAHSKVTGLLKPARLVNASPVLPSLKPAKVLASASPMEGVINSSTPEPSHRLASPMVLSTPAAVTPQSTLASPVTICASPALVRVGLGIQFPAATSESPMHLCSPIHKIDTPAAMDYEDGFTMLASPITLRRSISSQDLHPIPISPMSRMTLVTPPAAPYSYSPTLSEDIRSPLVSPMVRLTLETSYQPVDDLCPSICALKISSPAPPLRDVDMLSPMAVSTSFSSPASGMSMSPVPYRPSTSPAMSTISEDPISLPVLPEYCHRSTEPYDDHGWTVVARKRRRRYKTTTRRRYARLF